MSGIGVALRRRLLGSSFARNVGLIAGGTALGQTIVVLASPILTRIYTPDDFGYLALYTSVLSILSVAAALKYPVAIPLAHDDHDALALLAVSFAALLVVSGLLGVVLWAWGSELLTLARASLLAPYAWLLPVGLLGAGSYQILSHWAIRVGAYRGLASTRIVQGAGLAATQIAMGILTVGPLGLIVGDAVGRAAGGGMLLQLPRRQWRRARVTVARAWSNAVRYRRFPLLASGSSLLNSSGQHMPGLLLLAFYGAQPAGWFALSQRVIGVPMTLLGRSISQVYLGSAAGLARESPRELHGLYRKAAGRLFLLALGPSLLLAVASPWAFALVFGENWEPAGQYARVLSIMFLLQFVAVPLSQTLNIIERQDLQLAWDAGRFVLVAGVLWLAQSQGWTALQAVLGFSAAMAVAYLALFALCLVTLDRRRTAHGA